MFGVHSIVRSAMPWNSNPFAKMNDQGTESWPTSYGSQHDVLLENGLEDAEDPEDFQITLASLETVWESLVPGFHLWFTKHRYFYIYTSLLHLL